MVATYVPSLSEDGWVNSPELMGDYLLSHFFVSDYSQTQIYLGTVSSLPYIVQQYQDDLSGLLPVVQSALSSYLSKYFVNVIVEVNAAPNPTGSSQVGFSIYVSYQGADGNTYYLNKIIETMNSKISGIININNNG